MSEPSASDPPPAASAAETFASIECPHCGGTLRNVQPGANGRVRCLNCGQRFAVGAGGEASTEASAKGVLEPRAEVPREPGGAEYPMLRILGILVLGAACFGVTLWIWAIVSISNGLSGIEEFWGVSYMPIVVWLGWFLSYLPAAMARLDAGHVHLAWRLGKLTEQIPRPEGSSLPYILPCGVTLGLLSLKLSIGMNYDPGFGLALIGGVLVGAALLLGMVFDDVRLFLWRQSSLAHGLGKFTRVEIKTAQHAAVAWGWVGLSCAGTFGFAALALFTSWMEQRRWGNNSDEGWIWGLVIFSFIGVGWTLTRLARAFEACVDDWKAAAVHAGAATPDSNPSILWAARVLRLVWGAGIVLLFCLWIEENRVSGSEFFITAFMSLSFGSLAILLSQTLLHLHEWRRAQVALWSALGVQPRPSPASFPWMFPLLMGASSLCLLLGGGTMLNFVTRGFRVNELHEILMVMTASFLFLCLAIYPLFWLAFAARECVLAADAMERARGSMREDTLKTAVPFQKNS